MKLFNNKIQPTEDYEFNLIKHTILNCDKLKPKQITQIIKYDSERKLEIILLYNMMVEYIIKSME